MKCVFTFAPVKQTKHIQMSTINRISHSQILNRLKQSFNDVNNTLSEFDANILNNAEYQHTVTVLNICGGEFAVGIYSDDFESDNFTRFIYSINTQQAFKF